ncbi:MAG: M48 family metallopeptidase [bacterium]|nr:M48 family metallopeptidase [bacterium]
MANLYSSVDSNVRKTWVYLTGFLLFVIGVGWVISILLESSVILYVAVFLSIAMSFFSYWYSDRIVLSITRAKALEKQDNPELYRIVENLSITAGLPMPRVYVINDPQPNAFATGRDPEHGVVAVTTGLLQKLERVELEGVIAHELAHIGNRDILLSTIVVVLVGVIVLLVDFFARVAFWGGMGGRSDRGGATQTIILVASVAMMILAPLLAQAMKFAISRKREFLADATGALLTRYPEGLALALQKISQDPNQMRGASDATAHLFFANPFRGKERASWLHKMFMTHPPVEDRINALRGLNI